MNRLFNTSKPSRTAVRRPTFWIFFNLIIYYLLSIYGDMDSRIREKLRPGFIFFAQQHEAGFAIGIQIVNNILIILII